MLLDDAEIIRIAEEALIAHPFADLKYIHIGGHAMSPRDQVHEMKGGTSIGQELIEAARDLLSQTLSATEDK